MQGSVRKLVAVAVAIWLPLFSGNALAVSLAMEAMNVADLAVAAYPALVVEGDEPCPLHASAQQTHSAGGDQNQSGGMNDQHGSSCGNSGICHLACSGYMAPVPATIAVVPHFATPHELASTSFQSTELIPLDRPPLARA